IKRMLRKMQLTKLQKFCPVNNRMHQNILIYPEMPEITPSDNLILRKAVPVMNHFLVAVYDYLIYIISHHHVHFFVVLLESPQRLHDLQKRFFIQPVIAVHYLKILSLGMQKTAVDRFSMSAVLLTAHSYDIRVFPLVPSRDLLGSVFGSVIDNDDLDVLSSLEDRLYRALHVVL